MQKSHVAAAVCLAGSALLLHAPAYAQDPLGLYVGAGGGHSDVRTAVDDFGTFTRFDASAGAWQAFLGVRPLPFLGAEINYSWLGDPSGPVLSSGNYSDTRQTAAGAFGVAYLPLGVFDLYAKLGVARLHTQATQDLTEYPSCPVGVVPCTAGTVTYRQDQWDTGGAYGVGAQVHAGPLAVRADYLRFDVPFGHPDALTLGLSLSF
jgi:hypothetical protein